ncbi:unnamed protein product [Symbiodinium natans]|uniref:Uncharacterized protein n=1 Tax=Symbiodinium natans TaxID=878477 RepID=A0A812U328_9DINO|nr:unnamed protein product [Symbiodinium natans]
MPGSPKRLHGTMRTRTPCPVQTLSGLCYLAVRGPAFAGERGAGTCGRARCSPEPAHLLGFNYHAGKRVADQPRLKLCVIRIRGRVPVAPGVSTVTVPGALKCVVPEAQPVAFTQLLEATT